jgi:hypothetical protein
MRTRWIFLGGIFLTLLGVYLLYGQVLWFAMVQHSCDKYWDLDGCQSLVKWTHASIVAPGPGLAMITIAIYRFVRSWRSPVRKARRHDVETSRAYR